MGKWYVIQTRPRWEKKVADSLEQRGLESYCPARKVRRKWSDRIKTLEEPLFRACVMVKLSPEQKTDVRLLEGVVNFVYHNGKPAQVKEKQIRMLRKMLDLEKAQRDEEKERGRQQSSFQVYLENFQQWLQACLEKPKLI